MIVIVYVCSWLALAAISITAGPLLPPPATKAFL